MGEPRAAAEMLAGWAHDLGKPLLVIGNHGRKLVNEDGLKTESLELAQAIVALSDDALRVVDRLMESARPEEVSANRSGDLMRTLMRVVAAVQGLHAGCHLTVDGLIPAMEIDHAGLIYSVLVNLADNAIHACEDHQLVRMSARCVRDRLLIEVVDRGCGMSDFVRERAFEPYFTTRLKARPTGLGLCECRRLIEGCGGRIELASVEHFGTRASVIIPRRALRTLPAPLAEA